MTNQTRSALRQRLSYANAPPALRPRILRALDEEDAVESPRPAKVRYMGWKPQPFWKGASSGIRDTAIAAGIAFLAVFVLATPKREISMTGSDDLILAPWEMARCGQEWRFR
jgi:hypothetical protein